MAKSSVKSSRSAAGEIRLERRELDLRRERDLDERMLFRVLPEMDLRLARLGLDLRARSTSDN